MASFARGMLLPGIQQSRCEQGNRQVEALMLIGKLTMMSMAGFKLVEREHVQYGAYSGQSEELEVHIQQPGPIPVLLRQVGW